MFGHHHHHHGGQSGYLDVDVVGCRGVRGGGLMDKADPYVKLSFGGEKHKTRTDRDAGKNPNFNQTLTFSAGQQPSMLEVEVWDDDPLKDDFMAHGVVDVGPALQCGRMSGAFPLSGKHGMPNGEVQLDIRYRGPTSSSGYGPSPGGAYRQPEFYNQPPTGAYGYPPPPRPYGYPPPPHGGYGQPPYDPYGQVPPGYGPSPYGGG